MAQQPLTSFWPIFAGKSDGLDVVNTKGRVLRNGPTEAQLDKKPNDQGQCDFYRLIEKDDPKHIDWRKKLGGMLLREIGGKQHEDKWQQCILWELPESYILYEHIKTKADGQVKTVKNHSGGGHDRQDAYLYGYPRGPKKRFRSPVEFFPHLLWLCTDESSDAHNCTCKMCSPNQPEAPEKPAAVKVDTRPELNAPVRREATPSTPATGHTVVGRDPTVRIPVRRPSTGPPAPSPISKPATPVPLPAPTPSGPQIRAPLPTQSTSLPQPRSLEQQVDLAYNRFLCRTGEVVWFLRQGGAWGLGLVVRRWASKDNAAERSYLIQPLSHPYEAPAQELVRELAHKDKEIKPWLAWSAPECTFPYLQQNPQLSYAQVDWNALSSGQYGQGNASVDASLMAAKAIDRTYTLFDKFGGTTDEIRHYNGIYLGAEKIWRGEPVRLRIGSGTDLMVVTDIVERLFKNVPQKQPNTAPISQVIAVGDIYSYATIEVTDISNPPNHPQHNNNIPLRMAQDMAWRNRMLIPVTRTFAYWKLIASGSKLEISEIKGRWYETSLNFQESFTEAVNNNEGGNGIWMNSRGDATGLGKTAGAPRPDRVVAFGPSVVKGLQIVEGFDPPNQQPVQQQHPHDIQNHDINMGTASTEAFSLDDFMNVEHLADDANMEYVDNFPF